MKKKKGVVVFLVMIIAMLLLGYYSYGIVKGTAAKDNEKGIKTLPVVSALHIR